MALEFFRRRQKMVIIIMVALMVAFLIPSGLSMLMQRDPMAVEIATTRMGGLTQGDRVSAQVDLEILSAMGLGGQQYPPAPTGIEFALLDRNGENASLAYALLLQEARDAKIAAGERDVDGFFQAIGLGQEEDYRHLVATLRSPPRGWTEARVRQAVLNWLAINRSFADAMVDCPPSEPEVAVIYRDMEERIDLRVLRLKADDFLLDAREPNAAQVQAHFDRYRSRFAGQVETVDEFGFGYRQPDRAGLEYLLILTDVIGRVVEPPFDHVADYYNQNRSEFVKKVPAQGPATSPGAGAQPATQPTVEVPMTFAEAKGLIVEKLREEAARTKTEELVAQVEGEVRRFVQDKGDPNAAYAEACKGLQRSADKPLAAALKGLQIADLPLEEAVVKLAEAAKLRAICFPWGTHGDQTLLPSVKVTLKADGLTLGAALDEICRQVKWPRLTWATCPHLPGSLFSVADPNGAGLDYFPVQFRRTPLISPQDIMDNELLRYAFSSPSGGMPLLQAVFSAGQPSGRETPLVRVGAEGPRMYLLGDRPGRLLWRLLRFVPAYEPPSLDAEPGLRQQVVKDLRAQDAFQRALDQAERISKAAEVVGLEPIAAKQGKQTAATGLFPRKQRSLAWSEVAAMGLPAEGLPRPLQEPLSAFVIGKAFELVPKDVERGPAGEKPAIGIVPVRLRREVIVLERIGFRPVIRSEYEELGRLGVARAVMGRRQQITAANWFDAEQIAARVAFAWRRR